MFFAPPEGSKFKDELFVPSVFWDLYCAAPERRDSCEHSSEAKAFHDYVSIPVTSFRSLADQYSGSRRGNVALSERSTRYIRPIRYCSWKSLYGLCQSRIELLLIYILVFAFLAIGRDSTRPGDPFSPPDSPKNIFALFV